jgi:transposase-like protein
MFSVTAGTIFHKTHLPLQKWIIATFLICNAKKGISAKQIQRDLNVTYETAWYLMHRIRRAMKDSDFIRKFKGVVEADETYLGGRGRGRFGRGQPNKSIVIGIRQRDGTIRAELIPDVKAKTVCGIVRKHVHQDAEMLCVDEFPSYSQLAIDYNLRRVNHQFEYVNGQIYTNGVESFWAILKRAFIGTHHKMSKKYLPLYLNEFTFRFSHNGQNNLYRTVLSNALIYDNR